MSDKFTWKDGDLVPDGQQPRYPDITVKLIGEDGNAFNILGLCLRAMRDAGLPEAERKAFQADATSGDYQHLLATAQRWFDVT